MRLIIIALLIVATVATAQAEPRKRERHESKRERHESHNYIIERQQAGLVRGVPTSRLIIGRREIDIYRTGEMFEKNNLVGFKRSFCRSLTPARLANLFIVPWGGSEMGNFPISALTATIANCPLVMWRRLALLPKITEPRCLFKSRRPLGRFWHDPERENQLRTFPGSVLMPARIKPRHFDQRLSRVRIHLARERPDLMDRWLHVVFMVNNAPRW